MAPMRRVRRDARAALALSLGIVLALAAFSARQFLRDREAVAWVDHTQLVLGALADYRFALAAAESARRGYVITGAAREAAAHETAVAALVGAAARLAELTADNPPQNANARELQSATRSALSIASRIIERRRKGDVDGAARMIARREIAADTDRALRVEGAMRDSEGALLRERLARAQRLSRDGVETLAVSVACACAGIGLTLWMLLHDVDAHERVHRELARAKSLLQLVLDNARSAVYIVGVDGRMQFLNKECARVLHGTVESVAGRTLHEILPAEEAAAVVRNNRLIYEAGESVEVEETVSGPDGPRTFLSVKAPIAPLAGEGPALCGISTDITALKRHEARLEAVNAELEAFTYSVSHDLRAPLRAIDGFARILDEEFAPRLDDEGRRLLGRVRANADRMARLIDDLLSFSRLGRQELRRSHVDMSALARRAADECGAADASRSIRLAVEPLPPARGDAAMLSQVWFNLLSNAYKYTRPCGAAAITVGGRSSAIENEYWVKDNGVGFDPRHASKLFGVFSRLHGADEFEGTGVGLALVRRIVERHGGRVSAYGAVGAGAEFRFTLPHGRNA